MASIAFGIVPVLDLYSYSLVTDNTSEWNQVKSVTLASAVTKSLYMGGNLTMEPLANMMSAVAAVSLLGELITILLTRSAASASTSTTSSSTIYAVCLVNAAVSGAMLLPEPQVTETLEVESISEDTEAESIPIKEENNGELPLGYYNYYDYY